MKNRKKPDKKKKHYVKTKILPPPKLSLFFNHYGMMKDLLRKNHKIKKKNSLQKFCQKNIMPSPFYIFFESLYNKQGLVKKKKEKKNPMSKKTTNSTQFHPETKLKKQFSEKKSLTN